MKREKEYNTPQELLEFVLTECGDMKFIFNVNNHKLSLLNFTQGDYVVMAEKLMKRYFQPETRYQVRINVFSSLIISSVPTGLEVVTDLGDGWLEKLKIRELICCHKQLSRLPKLPQTLVKLNCRNNKLTDLPELPESLTELDIDQNMISELPSNIVSKFDLVKNQRTGYYRTRN